MIVRLTKSARNEAQCVCMSIDIDRIVKGRCDLSCSFGNDLLSVVRIIDTSGLKLHSQWSVPFFNQIGAVVANQLMRNASNMQQSFLKL